MQICRRLTKVHSLTLPTARTCPSIIKESILRTLRMSSIKRRVLGRKRKAKEGLWIRMRPERRRQHLVFDVGINLENHSFTLPTSWNQWARSREIRQGLHEGITSCTVQHFSNTMYYQVNFVGWSFSAGLYTKDKPLERSEEHSVVFYLPYETLKL